jgi:hypothetical protein
MSIEIPLRGDIPKVTGKHKATAMVEVSPGIDPKIIPTTTPTRIIPRVVGFITDKTPSRTMLVFLLI